MGRIDNEGQELPKDKWKTYCAWEDFDPEIDVVCVIFDRDYKGLTACLDEIFKLCLLHKIRIVISNPNFELWLLMHFPGLENYDKISFWRTVKSEKTIVPGCFRKETISGNSGRPAFRGL